MQRDKIKQAVWGRRYLLSLLFIRWAFLIPFICQLLKFQLFSLPQGFKGVVKAWGYAARNCQCARCCIGLA